MVELPVSLEGVTGVVLAAKRLTMGVGWAPEGGFVWAGSIILGCCCWEGGGWVAFCFIVKDPPPDCCGWVEGPDVGKVAFVTGADGWEGVGAVVCGGAWVDATGFDMGALASCLNPGAGLGAAWVGVGLGMARMAGSLKTFFGAGASFTCRSLISEPLKTI